jgi:DNA-binding NtrC family response regulator
MEPDGVRTMAGKRPLILVIDDDMDICEFFKKVLPEEGYEVTHVLDAKSGLDVVKRTRPDMVLLDLNMPEMGGVEGLRRIREMDPDAAVIMTTGYGSMETVKEAMLLGARDYLTKPFDIEILMDSIRKGFRESRRTGRTTRG